MREDDEESKEGEIEGIRAAGGGRSINSLISFQNTQGPVFQASPAKTRGEMYSPLIVGGPALMATWVLIPMIASRFGIASAEYNLPIALIISAMMAYLSKDSTALRNLGGQLGEKIGIQNIKAVEKIVCATIAASLLGPSLMTGGNLQLIAGGAAVASAVVGPEKVIEAGVEVANTVNIAANTAIETVKTAADVTTGIFTEASALVKTTQEAISILTRHSKVMRPAAITSGAIGITAYGLSAAGITAIGTVPIVYPMLIVAASILLVASIYCAIYDNFLQKSKVGKSDRILDQLKRDLSDVLSSTEPLSTNQRLIAEIQAGKLESESISLALDQKVGLLPKAVAGQNPEEQKSLLDSICKSAFSIIDRVTQLSLPRSR